MSNSHLPLIVVALGTTTLLAGCAPRVSWTPTQQAPRPMIIKRDVSSVEVFHEQAPARPHVEVGLITGEKKRSTRSDARKSLTESIHKKAARVGCDAIHVRDVSQPEIPGSKKQPPVSLQAGCLMWTGDASASEAAAAQAAAPGPAVAEAPVGAAPPGCANDMQCKGNRICENGQCVSPPNASTGDITDAGSEASSGQACDNDSDCPGEEICQGHGCASPS